MDRKQVVKAFMGERPEIKDSFFELDDLLVDFMGWLDDHNGDLSALDVRPENAE